MKTLLALSFVLSAALSTPALAQKYQYKGIQNFPLDSATRKVAYVGVIEVPGATQAQLYSRTKAWIASHYDNPKGVFQVDDPANGQLIGRGRVEFRDVATGQPAMYPHLLTFNFKDGKVRYEIGQIRMGATPLEEVVPANPVSKKTYDMWWKRLNDEFVSMASELKDAVTKKEPTF